MSAEPVVIIDSTHPYPLYFAAIDEAGVLWSMDCTHLHHTPEAAQGCFPRLRRRWANWAGVKRVHVPGSDGVVEMVQGPIIQRMSSLRAGYERYEWYGYGGKP